MSFIPFFIYLFIKNSNFFVFNIKLLGLAVMPYTPTPLN